MRSHERKHVLFLYIFFNSQISYDLSYISPPILKWIVSVVDIVFLFTDDFHFKFIEVSYN